MNVTLCAPGMARDGSGIGYVAGAASDSIVYAQQTPANVLITGSEGLWQLAGS